MNSELNKHEDNKPFNNQPTPPDNRYKKDTEKNLIVFLDFYVVIAKENINTLLSNIPLKKTCLIFWLNFAQNFKDRTFVELIQLYPDIEKTDSIKRNLKEILFNIGLFLKETFSTKENYEKMIIQNEFEIPEMVLRFYELYVNINNCELKYIIDSELSEALSKSFDNFASYSNIDLQYLREAFYGKVGYAFLDFKGNFVWADEYTKEILFEQSAIDKLNLFENMTDFSKYIIRNKYGNKFFDFKDEQCRIREFTYSIVIQGDKEPLVKDNNYLSIVFEALNSTKTLISRASAVLVQNIEENRSNACILLETKISPFRQNFDYFHWKKYIN